MKGQIGMKRHTLGLASILSFGLPVAIAGVFGIGVVERRWSVKSSALAADASAGGGVASRVPEPTANDQGIAEKAIRGLYKSEYASHDPVLRAEFARRLIRESESEADPAVKYVLLREARDLAATGGDYPTAADAIDHLTSSFVVDGVSQRTAALVSAGKSAATPKAAGEVAEGAMGAIEQAVKSDEYEAILKHLAPVAQAAAQRSGDAAVLAHVTDRIRDIRAMQVEFGRYKEAIKVLATDPDDSRANLQAGRFLAFIKRDWEHGLPHLVKSGDPVLSPLARQDIAAPTNEADQAKLGDAWLSVADKQPEFKFAAQNRADHWYALALPKLQGIQRLAVLKRLKELPPSFGFEQLSKLMAGGTDSSGRSGGKGAGGPTDFPPSPGMLVGVDYTVMEFGNRPIVKSLRPIFLTANGKVKGNIYGKPHNEWLTIEGKPGYAVGGVVTDGTDRFNGMKIIFMPVHGAVLDPDGAYDSPWIGGHAAKKLDNFGGDGRVVVGVQITSGNDIDAFGLVQVH